MITKDNMNSTFKPDERESKNIENSLTSFNKLSDLSRNSEVVYSRDGKLYNRDKDGVETQIGSTPQKITAEKRIYTLCQQKG
ncbi:MAG: hypothetical protein R3Y59_08345 [bacterium]